MWAGDKLTHYCCNLTCTIGVLRHAVNSYLASQKSLFILWQGRALTGCGAVLVPSWNLNPPSAAFGVSWSFASSACSRSSFPPQNFWILGPGFFPVPGFLSFWIPFISCLPAMFSFPSRSYLWWVRAALYHMLWNILTSPAFIPGFVIIIQKKSPTAVRDPCLPKESFYGMRKMTIPAWLDSKLQTHGDILYSSFSQP